MVMMRMRRAAWLVLALALTLLGTATVQAEERTFFAMDTVMSVRADGADAALLAKCEERIAQLEGLLSVTKEDSEIARLNRDGRAELSLDTQAILSFALEMGEQTQGALDVTLYPIVRAWGFTTGDYRVPSDDELAGLLSHVDYRSVTLENREARLPEGFMVDLGSVVKGYASDQLGSLLRENQVCSGIIDLGGNVYCLGRKSDGSPWRVGIQDPSGEGIIGSIAVEDRAVVTSGNYERCFAGEDGTVYGHIFDPATGRPAESGLTSVTVIGPSGAECDALSTALFVMGVERAAEYLKNQDHVEAIMLDEDGMLWVTEGIAEDFIPSEAFRAQRTIQ